MNFNWQAVTAIAAIVTVTGSALGWFVRMSIRDEIRKLNGYYILASGSKLTGHEIEQRLGNLESAGRADV